MSTPTDDVRELQDSYRILVENSDDILTIRDADGRIRYTNPSFHRILGYEQKEVVGSTCFDLLHPEDREHTLSSLNELMKRPGGRGSVQCRARHATGSWLVFEIVAYNLLDHPEVRGIVVNGREISERQQREAEKDPLMEEPKESHDGWNMLSGLLCICASCKKIQEESGSWRQIEAYIRERAQVEFSHGLCPECVKLWSSPSQDDE